MWIETVLLIQVATGLCLAAMNVGFLWTHVRRARRPARRIAALAVTALCAGQAIEAAWFLTQGGPSAAGPGLAAVALLTVRSLLTASTLSISILLVRAASRR